MQRTTRLQDDTKADGSPHIFHKKCYVIYANPEKSLDTSVKPALLHKYPSILSSRNIAKQYIRDLRQLALDSG